MNWWAIGIAILALLGIGIGIFLLICRELERDLNELDKEWWT